MSDGDKMAEIKARHQDAIDRFGHHYQPYGRFQKPTLVIGAQSFALDYDPEGARDLHGAEGEKIHRDWFGWMLCAALKNLVDEHTQKAKAKAKAYEALQFAEQMIVDLVGPKQGVSSHVQDVLNEIRTALYRFEWPDGDMTKAPIAEVHTAEETNE